MVLFGFWRSRSLQERGNLANLHQSWVTLSQHVAKVDKDEVILDDFEVALSGFD